jgi:prepilin peptidase CpaA
LSLFITPLQSTSSLLALLATVGIAAWIDWNTWRIPNRLIAASASAALLLAGFAADGIGWQQSLLGGLLGFVLFLPLYLLKGMAAGDVKLMMVIGLFTGPVIALDIALLSCLVGGAWAWVLVDLRKPNSVLGWVRINLRSRLPRLVHPATPAHSTTPNSRKQKRLNMIPYGVVIALGTLLTLMLTLT